MLQFGFNNGQTMVDGLYAGNTYQVEHSFPPGQKCSMLLLILLALCLGYCSAPESWDVCKAL